MAGKCKERSGCGDRITALQTSAVEEAAAEKRLRRSTNPDPEA
jgi:hypothetical protein